MTTIEQIKEECRVFIALAEKATLAPWDVEQTTCTNWIGPMRSDGKIHIIVCDTDRKGLRDDCVAQNDADAAFIAASRSFTPKAAQAMLGLIAYVEEDLAYPPLNLRAREKLKTIRGTWEGSK